MNKRLKEKYENLKKTIGKLESLLIAFSGGIDSALLLKVAHDALGENVIAVTANSPSLPRKDLEDGKRVAKKIGARHIIIKTEETRNEKYLKNPTNRCYYCKTELYSKLKIMARNLGMKNIANGTNYDDLNDYRPGLKSANENNILSPLRDEKITKKELRVIAKHLGLEIWDKPSSPCLSSRIPYDNLITIKKLSMVEKSEDVIRNFGIEELRVRHYGDTAKIEVNKKDFSIIKDNFFKIREKFRVIGFKQVILDNEGFRSGALNEVLNVQRAD